ncbi:MAG TPA: family 78 glycoside hydrolase catalytic domain [Clostridiales bacterium]|nr:family 78 glycoside hydrolase catalytic domain [Clostridiales bacterium]
MLKVYNLRTEYLEDPIGIDARRPRFSWKIESDRKNVMQSAYKITAAEDPEFKKLLWDSGKVEKDTSQCIRWDGPELVSGQRIFWNVTIWTIEEERKSGVAFFGMGLLNHTDWKAKWIEPEGEIDPDVEKPAPYIRKEFAIRKGLVSARAYMTARGVYTFYVNGTAGTDALFTPGNTSYYKRLQYQVYDITDLLGEGNNVLGVILGDGWWRGSTGIYGIKNNYGYKLAFLGQILLSYDDGTVEEIGSDSSFKTSYGPIIMSDLQMGERFDARINISGWDRPGYDDSSWRNVTVIDEGFENLIATRSVPVRRKERFKPRLLETPNGETVLDFGQNMSGWVELKVQGTAGKEVVLVHGETLDKEGNFTLHNLGLSSGLKSFQEIHYILSGTGEETYCPHFCMFGFRYALVKDYPGEIKADNFTAVAIYSDMEETGSFSCSNPMLNQLVSNSMWSQKSNFVDIPTDCPTRERAGWSGDAQLYSRTAADFMNVYSFFEKWMADLEAEQYTNGVVTNTIPDTGFHNPAEAERTNMINKYPMLSMAPQSKHGEPGVFEGAAGWGDAAVIIPWTMYLCYGDQSILENQYSSAKAWVDYMDSCAKNANERYKDTPAYHSYTDGELDADYIWDTKFHWGEWLEADKAGEDTNVLLGKQFLLSDPLTATAYYAYSAGLLTKMAELLGKKEDAGKYGRLCEKVKRVYNKYFIKENGHILDDRQAPNVRALAFNLAYEDKKQAVAARLDELVKEKDYHLNTGFLSTPFILHVLVENGYVDTAFRLLEQDTFPSWLYTVGKGATTIWENWMGISPEGELSGSQNHYSYGAVCDFLFAGIAGIRPVIEKPGYKHFELKPLTGGTLTHTAAKYESIYGTIESGWEKKDRNILYTFVIPANTTATVLLQGDERDVDAISKEFKNACFENGRIKFEVGSGYYNIMV